jgi:outer membrane protein assembly factor BamB
VIASPAVHWAHYGGTPAHTRVYAGHRYDGKLGTKRFVITTPGLMEFPPSYAGGYGYVATDSGNVKAFNTTTGATRWNATLGGVAADAPAIARGRVFVQTRGGSGFSALSAATGHLLWRLTGFGGESSPITYGTRVCGAATDGRIACWSQATGRGIWQRKVPCKVTASLTLRNGFLFFGCYKGLVYKLSAKHGKLIWKRRVAGPVYANVVVANGKLYVTCRDAGSIWALTPTDGRHLWTARLGGGAAYTSPAVTRGALYTTIRAGYYIKVNAATGRIMWRVKAPGLVMGSPVVTGNRVWFAAMGRHYTPGSVYGYNVNGMRRTFTFNTDGRYTPVTPAGSTLLLLGQTHIYGLAS